MKISRIDLSDKVGVLPQLYLQKNSTALLVAGIVGSAITSVGAVASSSIQSDAASSMNRDTRQWQSDEWSRQFELTNQRQDELNAYERSYNTPLAQAERLREAGFNPAALAAGSAMQMAQASPDVTAHSPAMPQTVNATPNDMGVAKSFEALGSLVKNLASAQKDGADTTKIMSLLNTEVEKAVQDLRLGEVVIAMHKQEYFFNDKAFPIRLKKLNEEYLNLAAKTYNEALTGKEIVSRTAMLDAQKKLLDATSELTGIEKMRATIFVANSQRLFDATIDELLSRSGSNRASATASYAAAGMYQSQTEYNYALAQTENQLRDGKITLQQLQTDSIRIANTIGSSNMRTFVATEGDRLKALVSEYERQGFITETARANMQQAITNANWSEVEKYLGAMSQALFTITGVYNAGSMRIGSMSQMQRNQVQSEFNRILSTHWQSN